MTAAREVLTDAQRELLTQVLDRIVPAGGGLPGAGEIGVAEFVERVSGSKQGQDRRPRGGGNPPATRLLVDGLKQIELTAGSGAYADLDGDAQDEVLRAVESDSPDFFAELVRLTYVGYYSQPRIASALGLEARPPQPLGFELEQADLSPLDNVRKRGPVYREA